MTPEQQTQLSDLRTRVVNDAVQAGIVPSPGHRAILIGQIGDGEAATRSLIDLAYQ